MAQANILDSNIFYHFNLIDIHEIHYQLFLHSQQPEEVILAILGNLGNDDPEKIIYAILDKLEEIGTVDIGKFVFQLKVISKLRNLQELTYKILKTMPLKYDIKNDVAFVEGKELGIKEGIELGAQRGITKAHHDMAARLIQRKQHSLEEIADITGLTITFIQSVEKELKNKK